jgi:hypothetical protein
MDIPVNLFTPAGKVKNGKKERFAQGERQPAGKNRCGQ